MIFDTLTMYEKEMVMVGFDNMALENQNSLINAVAKKLGLTLWQVKPEHVLTHHKNIKLSMMNEFCEIAIAKGFTSSNGHKYRLNQDDRENFLGMMMRLIRRPEMVEVAWKTEDAGYINHTRDGWLAVHDEAFDHKFSQIMKYNEKFTAINNATDHAVIVATKWEGSSSLI